MIWVAELIMQLLTTVKLLPIVVGDDNSHDHDACCNVNTWHVHGYGHQGSYLRLLQHYHDQQLKLRSQDIQL